MSLIKQLNQQFSIDNCVNIKSGKGDVPIIMISTPEASAQISLLGGQVISYQPTSVEHDLLFLSNNAYFETGKAIKGGSPICWPWFAAHPVDSTLPFHGLVRNQIWRLDSVIGKDNGDIVVTLVFISNEQTQQLWPHHFELKEIITISDTLGIELLTINTGKEAFNITQAIHSYFRVGDITQVQLTGLENKPYLDKVDQYVEKMQSGPITINQEVDRIYQHVDQPVNITDQAWDRQIAIEYSGSATCVVWNPWKEISQSSKDLEDNDYQNFICVETANAANNIIVINPGESHRLVVNYTLEEK